MTAPRHRATGQDTSPCAINNYFGSGDLGPIPSLFLWALVALGIGHFLLRRTSFGRSVLAVGGNATAARCSGINVACT